jgi:hypothetical protein
VAQNQKLRPSGTPTIELVRHPDVLPVFIVGSVRSGTSAMMVALRDGAEIRGFNEGVLAHLLPGLLASVQHHYGKHLQKPSTMLGSVPESFLTTGIKNLFGQAFVETMGTGCWLDKTPGGQSMVESCPSLLEIFPNAKFIYCQRRGIENVLSRQNKFRDGDFEAHCRGWALTMEAWLQTAPKLGASAISVDQRDMALDPEGVSRKVSDFLGLSMDQREGVLNALRSQRLEQTRAANDDAPVALEQTGWSEAEQDLFRSICGPMMTAFGYDMDGAKGSVQRKSYSFFVPVADGVAARRENIPVRKASRSMDARRFKLDPNPHGEPAAGLRHRIADMTQFGRFSAWVRLAGPGVARIDGLVFRFSLEGDGEAAPKFTAEQTIKAGRPVHWTVDLPALSGACDAVLSVSPVSPMAADDQVSAIWIDAQLT